MVATPTISEHKKLARTASRCDLRGVRVGEPTRLGAMGTFLGFGLERKAARADMCMINHASILSGVGMGTNLAILVNSAERPVGDESVLVDAIGTIVGNGGLDLPLSITSTVKRTPTLLRMKLDGPPGGGMATDVTNDVPNLCLGKRLDYGAGATRLVTGYDTRSSGRTRSGVGHLDGMRGRRRSR